MGPAGLEEQVAECWNGSSALSCKNSVAVCIRVWSWIANIRGNIWGHSISNFKAILFLQYFFFFIETVVTDEFGNCNSATECWWRDYSSTCIWDIFQIYLQTVTQMDYPVTFPDDLCRVCSPAGPWESPQCKYLLPSTPRTCLTSRLAPRRIV